jgi:hypothetical protein
MTNIEKKRLIWEKKLDYFGKNCVKKVGQLLRYLPNQRGRKKFFKDFEKKFWKPEPSFYFCNPKRDQPAR